MAVKLLCEQHFPGPDGVRGVDHDDVEPLLAVGDEGCAVVNDEMEAGIVEGALGMVRQPGFRHFHHGGVDFYLGDVRNVAMFQHLSEKAAIAAADD